MITSPHKGKPDSGETSSCISQPPTEQDFTVQVQVTLIPTETQLILDETGPLITDAACVISMVTIRRPWFQSVTSFICSSKKILPQGLGQGQGQASGQDPSQGLGLGPSYGQGMGLGPSQGQGLGLDQG